ncbi:hypothetical protein CPB84DRAFT_1672740 [Gymnopilus junonius]|uniref:Uncharacterized protein n=1 Tax=Gymnopilus junonius TaxID=109634 RepID=A0A9P5NYM7_GYMJU|nr:hypothetical protein CPB84DRAFT_1672740 [Gymnopilus junonius]
MSFLRGATPLMGAVPSLEASNQAQIEDLVQRNRTLEHANKKLNERLAVEMQRGRDNLNTLDTSWKKKEESWNLVCEGILTSCQIVQRRLEVETEAARSAVIKEMAVTREEKLQRLQRDFKIKLFQIREEELERKIEELEDENARLAEETERELQMQREKCLKHSAALKETRESLARSLRDNERKEEKYNKLVADRSNMEAKNGTLDSQLQRVQLQLEGSRTKVTELERGNDELKRTIADQTRQLERWQNLETKGGEAAEKHYKEKVELEFRYQELKEAFEKHQEERQSELDKEKKRAEKLKDAMHNWENEFKAANKQVAKLQKLSDKLKEELEVERARVRPPSPQVYISEVEAEDEPEPEPEPELAKKRQKGKAKATDNDEEQETEGHPKQSRKRKAGTTDPEQSGEDDVEIVDKPKPRRKGSRAPSEIRETKVGNTKTKPVVARRASSPLQSRDQTIKETMGMKSMVRQYGNRRKSKSSPMFRPGHLPLTHSK